MARAVLRRQGRNGLAVSYAGELARWGIETSIVVPGAFTKSTSHFAHAGAPTDTVRAAEYADGPTGDIPEVAMKGLSGLEPPDADAGAVAEAIVRVVDMPFGKRPFRVHIDPSQDAAEIVNGVADRVRAEILRRIGLGDGLAAGDSRGCGLYGPESAGAAKNAAPVSGVAKPFPGGILAGEQRLVRTSVETGSSPKCLGFFNRVGL